MNVPLKGMQKLLLWKLAVADDGEFLKEIGMKLTAAERKALVREGLITEGKRADHRTGRAATYLTLDERGWSWCQEHLEEEIGTQSKLATPILERLLKLLAAYFDSQDRTISFGQFVLQARQKRTEPSAPNVQTLPGEENGRLEQAIRAACLQLGEGRRNVRIRLADLRDRVDAPRPQLDQKLLEMERGGELSLYPLENPQEIGPPAREAVLRTAAGNERHILYFEGRET
jgi:hypothetical protein